MDLLCELPFMEKEVAAEHQHCLGGHFRARKKKCKQKSEFFQVKKKIQKKEKEK